ncbi:MAG: hypothetical protein RLN88_13605 [Ekhidna sp.]|uniref:hypothetical protein n=1 Tax=Ekhidna sp. TaxID=2608089 RepID=UPI0032EC01AC
MGNCILLLRDLENFSESSLLTKELQRFDIRAEIVEIESSKKSLKQQANNKELDALIVVGTVKMLPLVRYGRKRGIQTFFFHQSLLDKRSFSKISKLKGVKIYKDVDYGQGSLLADYIKGLDLAGSLGFGHPYVTILGFDRTLKGEKLFSKLSEMQPAIQFKYYCLSENLDEAIKRANESNAVIALDQFSNMVAVLTNAPVINVYHSSLFKTSGNKESVINQYLKRESIRNLAISRTGLIINELDRILSDHQYCAGILGDYQELKSILGNKPFARYAAQEIVELLEDRD